MATVFLAQRRNAGVPNFPGSTKYRNLTSSERNCIFADFTRVLIPRNS